MHQETGNIKGQGVKRRCNIENDFNKVKCVSILQRRRRIKPIEYESIKLRT